MEPDEEGGEEVTAEVRVNYDYLLGMPIASLTLEKVRASAACFGSDILPRLLALCTTPAVLYILQSSHA